MTDIYERVCAKCKRVIDLNDLSINEGRPYHDHCLLQTMRTRIAQLDDKMGRKTATVLDGLELHDLLFVEQRMRMDMETASRFKLSGQDKPIFKGNTALGLHSVMNTPTWKKNIAKGGTLEGTKYHMHKTEERPPTAEPVWQIITDENGHKGMIQIGSKPITNTQKKVESIPEPNGLLPCGQQSTDVTISKKQDVDYEAERININIWRSFELLDKLVPIFENLELRHRIEQLNSERNPQGIKMVLT